MYSINKVHFYINYIPLSEFFPNKKLAPTDCEIRFNFEDAGCVRKYAMFRP